MGLAFLVKARNGREVFRETISDYMGFQDFRVAWSDLLETDLDQMDGYGGRECWEGQIIESFFDHSDCDGRISCDEAISILERARKDASRLPEFRDEFEVLIAACEKAIKHETAIIFC